MSARSVSGPQAVTSSCDFFRVSEQEETEGVFTGLELFSVRAGVPTEDAEAFADIALTTASSLLDHSLDDGSPVDGDTLCTHAGC